MWTGTFCLSLWFGSHNAGIKKQEGEPFSISKKTKVDAGLILIRSAVFKSHHDYAPSAGPEINYS